MRKARRVRFLEKENDDIPNNEPNISPRAGEAARPRAFDAPKTSEYAFFKKIKKDAGCNYCCVQPEEGNQLKTGKSHNPKSVGTPNLSHILKCREPDAKFSFLAEEVGAAKQNSFASPSKNTSHNVKDSSSQLSGNVAPFDQNVFFSPIASTSLHSGNQHFGKGIFAGKRKKLHQLAADTLLPEIGKSCSEGLDLVSTLLDRLFPKGNENDQFCQDPKLREEKIHNCHQLAACSISDVPEVKLNLIHRKRSRDLENESTWDDFTPRYSSSSAKSIFISEADHPLAIYDAKAIFSDEVANHNYMSDPKVIGSWCRQSDSSLGLPYEKYGHTGSLHIQEPSEHYDPFEASITEPHSLLLGWDFNRHEGKPDFYSPASSIEEHMYSRTSKEFHNQQIVDDELDESAFSRLSFFSQYSPRNNLFTHFHGTGLHIRDIRRELKYDSSVHLGQGQLSSRLSYSPKYLTQADDCDTDDALGSGSIIPSDQDHPLHIRNFFNQKHWYLPRGLDFDLGWKCLSVSNLHGETQLPAYHAFHYPLKREISQYCQTKEEQEYYSPNPRDFVSFSEGSPSYDDHSFSNSLNRAIGRPLLLDNSSWNRLLDDDDH